MTTIRATCPRCGEVDLTPEQILLTIVRAEDTPVGPDSHYAFDCPTCSATIKKPADERIAHLLTTGGVEVVVFGMEDLDEQLARLTVLPHPERPAHGPPLSYDDLLDFHFLLTGDDWFEALTVTA